MLVGNEKVQRERAIDNSVALQRDEPEPAWTTGLLVVSVLPAKNLYVVSIDSMARTDSAGQLVVADGQISKHAKPMLRHSA